MGVCEQVPTCAANNSKCTIDGQCCSGLSCVGGDKDKTCMEVTVDVKGERCMPLGGKCNFGIECCSGSTCAQEGEIFRCLALPKCWSEPFKNCDQSVGMPPCCDGLLCVEDTTGMTAKANGITGVDDMGSAVVNGDFNLNRVGSRVCKPAPKCAGLYGDCRMLECCPGDSAQLRCVPSADKMLCIPLSEVPRSASTNDVIQSTFENVPNPLKETPRIEIPAMLPAPFRVSDVPGSWLFYSDMWNAGDRNVWWAGYRHVAKTYTKMDCRTRTLCIRVEAQRGFSMARSEAWFKDYGLGGSGKYPELGSIEWFSNWAGWQQCFHIPNNVSGIRRSVEIHANWNNGNTASTGKRNLRGWDVTQSMRVC